jgi:hypothetical protein
MKRKIFMGVLLIFGTAITGRAQTAHEIESLLATQQLSYGQAARFVLEAADAAALPGPEAAFAFAEDRNWLPKNSLPTDTARVDGISLLIMRAFDLKGGLFFSVFKNAHYAYKEMVYRKLIQDRTDPNMPVSGEFLLFVVGRVLSLKEGVNLTVLEGW